MNQKIKCRFFRLFSFILPILVLCVYFIKKEVAPFGGNTFLIFDMNAQYIDFFAYMRSILSGVNNFSYSFSRGLGGDFRSFFAYYLTSPFNLITILLPDEIMPVGISLEMMILFGLAGLSCFYALERLADNQNYFLLLFLSSAYALSGWMLMNAANFQFIPEAIVIPMVAWTCQNAKVTGKIWPAVLWLTISVILNFYIGYMIFIFAFLWLVIPEKSKIDPKLFVIFIISAVISSPIWLPVLKQLGSTVKSQNNISVETIINFSIPAFLKKFLPGQFDHNQYMTNGLPAVYCSMISVILCAIYFIMPGNVVIKRHRAIIIAILVFSMFFHPITLIWHGFSNPYWWPYRFSFLLIFMIILCAASCNLKTPVFIFLFGFAGIIYNLFVTFDVIRINAEPLRTYTEAITRKKELLGKIPQRDELFRIEDLNPRCDNDAMFFSYAGITNFDSLANKSVLSFLDSMGFPIYPATVHYGSGNTEFANSLLGVRYVLDNESVINRDVPASMAYLLPAESNNSNIIGKDAAEFQNNIAKNMGNASEILYPLDITETSMENLECNDMFCWKPDPGAESYIQYQLALPELINANKIYAHVDESFLVGDLYFLTGNEQKSVKSPDDLIPLSLPSGEDDIVTIKILVDSAVVDKLGIQFHVEDVNAVTALFTPLMADISVNKISSSALQITLPKVTEKKLLLTTIPYDSRWSAVCERDPLKTVQVWDTFLGVEVPAGDCDIRLDYR